MVKTVQAAEVDELEKDGLLEEKLEVIEQSVPVQVIVLAVHSSAVWALPALLIVGATNVILSVLPKL
jgi:hypothetical protein